MPESQTHYVLRFVKSPCFPPLSRLISRGGISAFLSHPLQAVRVGLIAPLKFGACGSRRETSFILVTIGCELSVPSRLRVWSFVCIYDIYIYVYLYTLHICVYIIRFHCQALVYIYTLYIYVCVYIIRFHCQPLITMAGTCASVAKPKAILQTSFWLL